MIPPEPSSVQPAPAEGSPPVAEGYDADWQSAEDPHPIDRDPGEDMDSDRPTTRTHGLLVVGMGAAAGGLAALQGFFSALPKAAAVPVAFVVVQHMSAEHKSLLAELIQRHTAMNVLEATDGLRIEADHIYIIPPNYDMGVQHGHLRLFPITQARGQRMPIDSFLHSLARDQRDHAVAIILSGNGCDGSSGLREIKAEGGMVMAQLPESAEFDGMPRNAVATGIVDFTLSPAEMPAQLLSYAGHACKICEDTPPDAQTASQLKQIFRLLKSQTGHDFSQYKPSTIQRRIERRMSVRQISTLNSYISYLRKHPEEVEALFRDMLVFSEQNITKDPPFSRVDLITCRNLLIYLNYDLQKKLIPLFHYALNPGGFLLRGTPERIG